MTAPASAELGETQDPRALVPGSPEVLGDLLADTDRELRRVRAVVDDLAGIRTPTWSGLAAESWHRALGRTREQWDRHRQALEAVIGALHDYTAALRDAQAEAARAIQLYRQGEAASAKAHEEYGLLMRAAQAAAYLGGPAMGPVAGLVAPLFTDPGEASRLAARVLLSHARHALDRAGDEAAKRLGQLDGALITSRIQLLDLSPIDGSPKLGADADGMYATDERGYRLDVARGRLHAEDYWGDVHVEADADHSVGGEMAGTARLDQDGLALGGRTQTGISGHNSLNGEWGYLHGGVRDDYLVGRTAEGKVQVGPDGVGVHGEVFTGARYERTLSADLAGVGANVSGEAWVGAGATADAGVTTDDRGRIVIGAHLGVGLGFGGKFGGEVVIDPDELTGAAWDAVDAIGAWFGG